MRIQCTLSSVEYLSAMQEQMSEHFAFWQERFTGFFLGRFFSVTYHSGHEFNRRITNQKDTAIGYVKKTADGCEVRCIRLKAMMAPTHCIPRYCVMRGLFLAAMFLHGIWDFTMFLQMALITLGILLVIAPISAVVESCTEQGEVGRRTIISFLLDPSDPYANYKNIR